MTTLVFQSALAPTTRQLLAVRHSLGYQDKTLGTLLASFDRYFFAHGRTDPWLTNDIVEAWVASDSPLTAAARAHRYSALRLLGRFLAEQHPQTYVPGPVPGLTSSFRPHIYPPTEIQALLEKAAHLRPVGSLRPRTFVTLIGLLYCTGIRVSEALATGIRGAPNLRGPRLHDLRHSFAVHRLLAWYRDGGDVQARLPLLSTYLGHVCLISTQVYLNITAKLLQEAASRFHAPALPGASGELS